MIQAISEEALNAFIDAWSVTDPGDSGYDDFRAGLEAAQLVLQRDEPTSARQAVAEAALIKAWPDLADDPVHVEQLAGGELNAAYNPTWRDHS